MFQVIIAGDIGESGNVDRHNIILIPTPASRCESDGDVCWQSTLIKCLAQNVRKSDELGSSGGAVGLGGSTGRLKYAAMSGCSRNNNSGSSGGSYAEALADPSRRPLVVSFKRPMTSCTFVGPQIQLPVTNSPVVEDIEIFQESQLRIQRSESCRVREDSLVLKSLTEPCLTTH